MIDRHDEPSCCNRSVDLQHQEAPEAFLIPLCPDQRQLQIPSSDSYFYRFSIVPWSTNKAPLGAPPINVDICLNNTMCFRSVDWLEASPQVRRFAAFAPEDG